MGVHFILVGAANALMILALASNSRPLTLFIFLPLCIFLCIQAGVNAMDEGMPLDRLKPVNAATNTLLRVLELLVCTDDPQRELRRDSDGQVDVTSQPFSKRLEWATALCFTQRGAGWNWRVRGTPPSPEHTSRWMFVLRSLLYVAVRCLVLEAITIIFAVVGHANTVTGYFIMLHALAVYLAMTISYDMFSVVWVSVGVGCVEECPPLFGSLRHSRSLRGFWGKTWHQSFRRPITIIPNRISAIIGLHNDNTGVAAFFIIAIYHVLTVYAASSGNIWFGTFAFFSIQPVGFFIEWYILNIRSRPAWVGYAWVVTWLVVTGSLYFSDTVDAGLFEDPRGWVVVPVLGRLMT